ncbi:hypothetical protein [Mucilaginibacter sp. PAMB04168]|uniref:hypothetical protein n=1 Tax=Mucilaginibacter sp. PAMB04168 TaxID=3138567 RepID=UPI0031F6B972
MSSVICTLFEGHYHFGVASLVNSLQKNGFAGDIFAGYRGSLPFWAADAKESSLPNWPTAYTFTVSDQIQLHFLPLTTEYHLTNYKPNFLLELWDGPAKSADNIFYFDPDITVKCEWEFFESWVQCGVALVHERSMNDMPPSHPLRQWWFKVIEKCGKTVTRDLYSYINGGFCGVNKRHIEFLQTWVSVMDAGFKYFELSASQFKHKLTRSHLFQAQDQDGLNITAMCSLSPISEIGPEGMDLISGGKIMSHALGSTKPWKKKFIRTALRGKGPSLADKHYWLYAKYPIKAHSDYEQRLKKTSLLLSSFIHRFYRKG